MTESLINLIVMSGVKFLLWCGFTSLGYWLLDKLTSTLPFIELSNKDPRSVVAILIMSGFAALKIVESFKIGLLL